MCKLLLFWDKISFLNFLVSCGSVNPVRSVVKENNIAFMVSLSEDHESFNPIESIKSIVNNIEENVNVSRYKL